MAKLLEKDGAEMCAALVSVAAALKRFMEDEAFDKAWKNAMKKGVQLGNADILKVYVDLAPLIFGKEHINDTMSILSVIEGKPVKELLKMNGTELIADTVRAFNEQLKPFFTQLGISVGKQ